jgi:hypothetical protein
VLILSDFCVAFHKSVDCKGDSSAVLKATSTRKNRECCLVSCAVPPRSSLDVVHPRFETASALERPYFARPWKFADLVYGSKTLHSLHDPRAERSAGEYNVRRVTIIGFSRKFATGAVEKLEDSRLLIKFTRHDVRSRNDVAAVDRWVSAASDVAC